MSIKSLSALLLITASNLWAAPDYYAFIKSSEGVRYKIYLDSRGNPTVGVGHLITGADQIKSIYTERDIQNFFAKDCAEAEKIARQQFSNFDTLPDNVKEILVSLCFNLGQGGISKFKNFKKYIHACDYKNASRELKDSAWFRQVGLRGPKYVKALNSAA